MGDPTRSDGQEDEHDEGAQVALLQTRYYGHVVPFVICSPILAVSFQTSPIRKAMIALNHAGLSLVDCCTISSYINYLASFPFSPKQISLVYPDHRSKYITFVARSGHASEFERREIK